MMTSEIIKYIIIAQIKQACGKETNCPLSNNIHWRFFQQGVNATDLQIFVQASLRIVIKATNHSFIKTKNKG